jgi:hypothetical protein
VRIVLLILSVHAAHADATITVEKLEAWQHQGNGNGPVHVEMGEVRLDAKEGATASAKIAAQPELVQVLVSLGGRPLRPRFFLEIEDGHEYLFESDPCCFLRVSDARERSRRPARLRANEEAEISVDDDAPLKLGRQYRPLPLRSDIPVPLTVTPKNGEKFVVWALLRHGHRYTLVPADKKIVRDR